MTEEIVFYHNPRSRAQMVHWMLEEAGAPYRIVPIPGTKRADRVDENLAALDVTLSSADVARISAALPPGAAAGTRYPEAGMKGVHI